MLPLTPEAAFALRASACPQSGKGRAIAKRRRNSAALLKNHSKQFAPFHVFSEQLAMSAPLFATGDFCGPGVFPR
jgi:hypothetical protein